MVFPLPQCIFNSCVLLADYSFNDSLFNHEVVMKLRQFQALKATLEKLALLSQNILVYGKYEDQSFCYPISISKAKLKLLACNNIEIRGIGYFAEVEKSVVSWLQAHIRLPSGRQWLNMANPSNWLKYNFSQDLYIMHLSIASKHYYLCIRHEYVQYYRQFLALPHHG